MERKVICYQIELGKLVQVTFSSPMQEFAEKPLKSYIYDF